MDNEYIEKQIQLLLMSNEQLERINPSNPIWGIATSRLIKLGWLREYKHTYQVTEKGIVIRKNIVKGYKRVVIKSGN